MPRLVRHSVLVIIGKHISLPKSPKGPSQSRKVSKSLFPSVRQGRLRECSSCGPRESYTKHHYLGHEKPGCSFQSRSLELRSPGPASHPHQTPAPFQGSGRTACKRLLPILGNPTAFPTGPWSLSLNGFSLPTLCKACSLVHKPDLVPSRAHTCHEGKPALEDTKAHCLVGGVGRKRKKRDTRTFSIYPAMSAPILVFDTYSFPFVLNDVR